MTFQWYYGYSYKLLSTSTFHAILITRQKSFQVWNGSIINQNVNVIHTILYFVSYCINIIEKYRPLSRTQYYPHICKLYSLCGVPNIISFLRRKEWRTKSSSVLIKTLDIESHFCFLFCFLFCSDLCQQYEEWTRKVATLPKWRNQFVFCTLTVTRIEILLYSRNWLPPLNWFRKRCSVYRASKCFVVNSSKILVLSYPTYPCTWILYHTKLHVQI